MRYSSVALLLAVALGTLGTATNPKTVIHPGDQLNVQVFGQPTLSQTVTVLPDGSIEYPLIGRVALGGQTLDTATQTMTKSLERYVRHPYVTVLVTQLGQPSVLVLGNVKTPGKYQLRSDAKVTDAIAAAGGIANANGDLPEARISDANGQISSVSLQKLLHDGDTALDENLTEGSVVYVPGPTMMTVVVSGAVDHPGDVQVAEGDRVSAAVARAGNSTAANSDLNNIRVIRTTPDGKQQTFNVNLYQALKEGNSSADIALQKNDEIYVPQASKKSDLSANPLLYLLSRLIP